MIYLNTLKSLGKAVMIAACAFGSTAAVADPVLDTLYMQDFEGAHGWTLNVVTGTQGADPNFWIVSDDEGGVMPTGCGVSGNGNNTLHITSVFNPTGGAAYDMGGLCGILFCPESNSRAESPAFSTVGSTNIKLKFNYIAGGDGLLDNASVLINTGSGWNVLEASLKSTTCAGGAGQWAEYMVTLPVDAENNPNVRVAIGWVNNDDGIGTDPSVAINDLVVYTESAAINTPPVFVSGTTTTLSVCKNSAAVNIAGLLHVADVDAAQTLTWAEVGTASAGGSVAITGTGTASGSVDITPAGVLTYAPATDFAGSETFQVSVSDGTEADTITVNVTVNDLPTVNTIASQQVCNGDNTAAVVFSGSDVTSVYTWSNSNASIGLAATGTGDITAFAAANATTATETATITVTPTANGCTGASDSFVITVYPTPVLTSTLAPAAVCDSTLFSYVPASDVSGVTYSWSRAAVAGVANIATTGPGDPMEYLDNTTPFPVAVDYIYTLTANGCNHSQTVSTTVNPTPVLSSSATPAAICDNSVFSYTPVSFTPGTTYSWSRAAVAGIANAANADNGAVAESLDNTIAEPVAVTYVFTLTANSCANIQSVAVNVNPTATLSTPLMTGAICDSTLFSYMPASVTIGTTFSWRRDAMTGITNATASGVDNPMEYLVNTTALPIDVAYVYTLTANGCDNIQTVMTTINPDPRLSNESAPAAICDSSIFSFMPESLTGGATFAWSRGVVTGIANPAGSGTDNPLEPLYNTTSDSIIVSYVFTLTAYGCSNTQQVDIVVKPTPKLSSTLDPPAVCNSTLFSYLPTSATSGTMFTWTRAIVPGISNPAASGSGDPMETLTNTLANPVTVGYVFTLAASGCTGTQNVNLQVNSTPQLSGSTVAAVCSGAPFNYAPGSTTTGTSFAWTRAVVAGVTNVAASGTGNINEALVNTTLAPKSVTYRYTLTANGCSAIQNVLVAVDPAPAMPVIAIASPNAVCSNTMYQNFGAATDAPDTVEYAWTAIGATVEAQGAGRRYSLVSFPATGLARVVLSANASGFACFSRDTFNVTVSSADAPNAAVYYVNGQFLYTDNTVESYQWGYDDAYTLDSVIFTGQVDQNFRQATPDFTGKKYWVMTTKNGCSSKNYYNAPVVVEDATRNMFTLQVAPNPATSQVKITIEGTGNTEVAIEIVDMAGRVVATHNVVGGTAIFNIDSLASGMYLVKGNANGYVAGSVKLVKN